MRDFEEAGLRHEGLFVSFLARRHRIDLADLTGGKAITVYGQNEVVRDLIDARTATTRPLYFEAERVSVGALDSSNPVLRFQHEGTDHEVHCDFLAGCDGFHGICRPSIPQRRSDSLRTGLPVRLARDSRGRGPSSDELGTRTMSVASRCSACARRKLRACIFKCLRRSRSTHWSDEAIWDEMLVRMTTRDGWRPNVGRILQKSVTPMRSFVAAPMRYGRLFLAGDSAHIVPPTGAKGMNLAASDVLVLSRAIKAFYERGRTEWLDEYSDVCLRRVWKAQRFSWWMTSTLHRALDESEFDHQRQIADLDYLTSSRAAMTSLAEQYVGLPAEVSFESAGLCEYRGESSSNKQPRGSS